MASGGLYASMWERQLEANEAEARLRAARENDDLGIVVRKRKSEEKCLSVHIAWTLHRLSGGHKVNE